MINLLDNTELSWKCWIKLGNTEIQNWVAINNDAHGTYSTNRQIKLKTSIRNSNSCGYSDAYILVKGTISIAPVPPPAANPNNNDKEVALCSIYWLCKWNKEYRNRQWERN